MPSYNDQDGLDPIPLDDPFFALGDGGARHWAVMDGWTIEESAILLMGADPLKIRDAAEDEYINKPDYNTPGYRGINERLARADITGTLHFPARPADILRWAKSKHAVPEILEQYIATDEAANGGLTAIATAPETLKVKAAVNARNDWQDPVNLKILYDKSMVPGVSMKKLAAEFKMSRQGLERPLKKAREMYGHQKKAGPFDGVLGRKTMQK